MTADSYHFTPSFPPPFVNICKDESYRSGARRGENPPWRRSHAQRHELDAAAGWTLEGEEGVELVLRVEREGWVEGECKEGEGWREET
jgi:hypothetical protein